MEFLIKAFIVSGLVFLVISKTPAPAVTLLEKSKLIRWSVTVLTLAEVIAAASAFGFLIAIIVRF